MNNKFSGIESYDSLAQTALREISEQVASGGKLTQVCGPISTGGLGSVEKNTARFERVIDLLKQNGYHLFDQMPYEDAMMSIKSLRAELGLWAGYDHELLDVIYGQIFQSGLVDRFIFIPGFESSYGAKWEEKQAKMLGIERFYLDEQELEQGNVSLQAAGEDLDALFGPANFPWLDVDGQDVANGLAHGAACDLLTQSDLLLELCFFDRESDFFWTNRGHKIDRDQVKAFRVHATKVIADL